MRRASFCASWCISCQSFSSLSHPMQPRLPWMHGTKRHLIPILRQCMTRLNTPHARHITVHAASHVSLQNVSGTGVYSRAIFMSRQCVCFSVALPWWCFNADTKCMETSWMHMHLISRLMHVTVYGKTWMMDWIHFSAHTCARRHIFIHSAMHASLNLRSFSQQLIRKYYVRWSPSHLCCLFIRHMAPVINQMLIKLLNNNFCLLQETSVLLSLMYVIQWEGELLQAAQAHAIQLREGFFSLMFHFGHTLFERLDPRT